MTEFTAATPLGVHYHFVKHRSRVMPVDLVKGANNGARLQSWLNASAGKEAFLPQGTWMTNSFLVTPPNLTVEGVPGDSEIICGPTFPSNQALLAFNGNHVTVRNIVLDGNKLSNPALKEASLIFSYEKNFLTFENLIVRNNKAGGMGFLGCKNVTIEACEVYETGVVVGQPGFGGIWVEHNGVVLAERFRLYNTWIHNTYFHGCLNNAINSTVEDCTLEDITESGFFATSASNDQTYKNNKVSNLTEQAGSASAFELGGSNIRLVGNRCTNNQKGDIALTGCRNVLISGHYSHGPGGGTDADIGAITLLTTPAIGSSPRYISITGSYFYAGDGPVKGGAPIVMGFGVGAEAIDFTDISGNISNGTWTSGASGRAVYNNLWTPSTTNRQHHNINMTGDVNA